MAHPQFGRESLHRLVGLPLLARPCMLCGLRSPSGALCRWCRHALLRPVHDLRCPRCALALPPLALLACPDCGAGQFSLQATVAGFDYEHPGDMLIHAFKISRRLEVAAVLAELMLQQWRRYGPALDDGCRVIAVPSQRDALRRRGFNPAAVLAQRVARRLGLAACLHVVALSPRQDVAQKFLGRQARRQAMRGAFQVLEPLDGRAVLLIDDVLTTGATLDALARACRVAGAGPVYALVAARAPWKSTRF
ncbi:ComF family protein [Alcaligenes sp. Lyrl_28]|uniref:ComF family protein n=1 Tax=Alcaligenes sp. Lyrl_28 TaxID=3110924 RepID=UPI003F7CBBD0